MEISKVVAAAIYSVAFYRWHLAKALAVPFFIYVLLDVFSYFNDDNIIGALLLGVLYTCVYAVFAITTHRVLLLGEGSVPEWGLRSWTTRESWFALHLVGLYLLFVPFSFFAAIPVVGILIALLLGCWVTGRLSLVLPGIALEHAVTFGQSWEDTEDHQTLMFFVVLIFPILLALPLLLVAMIPYSFLITSVLSTVIVVFEVAALSMAYRLISRERMSTENEYNNQ